MPQFVSKIAQRALFSDDDPFHYEIPGVGAFRLNDHGLRPPHESEASPTTAPVSYLIGVIANSGHTVEDRERMTEALTKAYNDGRISLVMLNEISEEIRDIYDERAKATVSNSTALPFGAPSA